MLMLTSKFDYMVVPSVVVLVVNSKYCIFFAISHQDFMTDGLDIKYFLKLIKQIILQHHAFHKQIFKVKTGCNYCHPSLFYKFA